MDTDKQSEPRHKAGVYHPKATPKTVARKKGASRKTPAGHAVFATDAAASVFVHLGFIQHDRTELVPILRAGAPIKVFTNLVALLGTSQKELGSLIGLPPATLSRRVKSKRLSPEESDRAYRVASAYRAALQLFEGEKAAAVDWLKQPAKALGGATPLSYLDTEAGAEAVHDLIGRIEHGVIT